MNEKYGFIYITTNLINNKKYIGQKKYGVKNCETYLGSGIILKQAIEKHGRENFKRDILEECYSKEELNEREKYWINYYDAVNSKNFYNIAIGGDGGNVIEGYTEERRKELKELHSKKSKEYIPSCEDGWNAKLSNSDVLKIVERLNTDEKLSDIAKDFNVSDGTISDILNKRTWLDLTKDIEINHDYSKRHYKTHQKPVAQYDLDGNFIAEYESAREAEKITRIGYRMISRVCKHQRPHTHGFIFKFI